MAILEVLGRPGPTRWLTLLVVALGLTSWFHLWVLFVLIQTLAFRVLLALFCFLPIPIGRCSGTLR